MSTIAAFVGIEGFDSYSSTAASIVVVASEYYRTILLRLGP
jgi:hypothetical protein